MGQKFSKKWVNFQSKNSIIDDKPYFYNLYHMWIEYKLHKKALIKWQILAKAKVPEHNFNISHNTNKSIADKVKFLTPAYKPYMDNPFFKDEQKELEYNLIQEFVADNEAMARAVSSINSLNVDVDTLNDSDILKIVIKSYQNNKHVLNSNTTIDYQMIERSWLTNVAFIHLKLNKSCMPVQKLSKFITTIAKATTKTYKNTSKKQIFTYSKLSNADFREVNIFYNLRLKELTDNRKEIKGSQGFIDEFSNFTDCISDKVHKMGIK